MTPLPVVPPAEDYPPLSALNDLLFCPRRCYLHRVEGVWTDNVHTVRGTLDHRRAHSGGDSSLGDVRVVRGIWLTSHRLRVLGVADIVEFHPAVDGGKETLYPVEYKRGARRRWHNDDVQLCAQAICLEEMLGVAVPGGAIYHVRTRRRREVAFDAALRTRTREAAERLHALLAAATAPPPVVHPKCKECSVQPVCLPSLIATPSAYSRAAAALFLPS
jgi:CRISPR-associated exonuclease Cas4